MMIPALSFLSPALLLLASQPVQAALDPRRHERIHPISPWHLLVELEDSHDPSGDPADWVLRSEEAGPYEEGLSPLAVSVTSRAAELIPEGWPYAAVLEHRVLLELPDRLTPDTTYSLRLREETWTLPFDPELDWSPSIKLNPIGYRADAPERWAYVSHWLGTLALMELGAEERAFRVVDAESGATVLEGELSLRLGWDERTENAYGDNYSTADVWEADLGALDEPGVYFLVWEGVGRSWPFTIDDAVWDEPFRTVFKALYQQRCGTALDPEFTAWSHEACHQHPVQLSDADYQLVGGDAFEELPAQATGETITANGGYHDAGDYDRRYQHLVVLDNLVDLYELFPERFDRDDLGLPESGNGLPDVLDEALWAIGLYASLQGKEGGVRAGVETTGYPEWETMPEDDPYTDWYAYAEDPVTSYRFAGAAAKLSRVLEPFDGAAAAQWRERALRAWAWAEAHPPTGYEVDADAAYAAAELLRTTGDSSFNVAFGERSVFAEGLGYRPAAWDELDVQPLWAYINAEAGDRSYQESCRTLILYWADLLLDYAAGTGYRRVNQPYRGMCYGSATTPFDGRVLIAAHQLTGDARYLGWLLSLGDLSLGANQAGISYVTGLGPLSVRHPLHHPSLADGIDDPVPGITVYGPAHYTSDGGILGAAIAAFSPPVGEWPIVERFVDVAYVPEYNEFTVQESIAPTLLLFGYLALLEEGGGEDTGDSGRDSDPADSEPAEESPPPDTGSGGPNDDSTKAGTKCGCASHGGGGWISGLLTPWILLFGGRRRTTLGKG